jgi:hypothetical protein
LARTACNRSRPVKNSRACRRRRHRKGAPPRQALGQSPTGGWTEESGTDLHAKLENVDVQPFLPAWFQTRLHGALQGNARFTKPDSAKEGELSGDLKLSGATLEAIPLFAALDSFTGNPRFHQIPLKNASAHFSQTKERLEFTELDLDGAGILRIQGQLTVKAGSPAGPAQTRHLSSLLQWLPEIRTKIFAEARDGYVWTPFELSGTTDQPLENLLPPRHHGSRYGQRHASKPSLNSLPNNLPRIYRKLQKAFWTRSNP